MPTNPGRKVAPIPPGQTAQPIGWTGNPLNPFNWLDLGPPGSIDGADQTMLMRGTGGALTWWQKRPRLGPSTIAQGAPFYLQSRPYSRGAGAYSPKFGVIPTNPIGAGVVSSHKLPVIAGPGARYQFGAIFFNVQAIPTTVRMSPTMPSQSVAALLATSSVAAIYKV